MKKAEEESILLLNRIILIIGACGLVLYRVQWWSQRLLVNTRNIGENTGAPQGETPGYH